MMKEEISTTLMDLPSTIIPNIIKDHQITFSWYDYIFFSLMLVASALVGIYFGCFGNKQSTTSEYLMGGKKMKVFPIAMSVIASHVSGISLLAVPAEAYRFGAAYTLVLISCVFVALATIFIFLPVFFKLQITSTYEYLERRFDSKCRMFASFLFGLAVFLYLPIVIYIPALAFSAATGVNVHLITPLVCGVCIFYTTLGGLKAVVWTDTLQFTVTIGALAAVLTLGVRSAGGFGAIIQKALEGNRLEVSFDLDPTLKESFWSLTIGLFFAFVATTSTNQGCMQKFLSVTTLREAQMSVVYFVMGMGFVVCSSVFTGLIMYAKYFNCDPFLSKQIEKTDQLLPYYVMDVAGHIPGLPGLFIAGVFCSGLSTLSAHLNCLAGTIYEDFVLKCIKKPSERKGSCILKMLVVLIGVSCTLLVFVVEKVGGLFQLALSMTGVTGGPLLGLFTLGVLFRRANSKGAFYGSIIGLILSCVVVFGAQYYKINGGIQYEAKPVSTLGCPNFNQTVDNLADPLNTDYYGTTIIPKLNTTGTNYLLSDESYNATTLEPGPGEKSVPFLIFRITNYYYTLIGFGATLIAGLIISYLTNQNDEPVDKELLSPIIHFLLPEKENFKNGNYYTVEKAIHIVSLNNDDKVAAN